jgi:nitrilase
MRVTDIRPEAPHRHKTAAGGPATLANSGSCLAGPDGEWVIAPVIDQEVLLVATLDHRRVREESQNFDSSGHYARPDALQLNPGSPAVNDRDDPGLSM